MKLRTVGLALAAVMSAHASLIVLTPSSVIGGSSTYGGTYNTGSFRASYILDTQAGPITESSGSPSDFWLNEENGSADAYITIDLGATYSLASVDLFNSHNAGYNDRGTGSFTIRAGNSVTAGPAGTGMTLTGGGALILTDTLTASSSGSEPIGAQSFSLAGSYRYLEFHAAGIASSGPSCCSATAYALNEMRIFDSPAPEPGSITLLLTGFAALLLRRRLAR